MLTPAEKGIWIDLLCVMMMSEPYGHLTAGGKAMTDEQVARLIGTDIGTYKGAVETLIAAGIPSFTVDGVMYSRRLVRDSERYIAASQAGHKGGGNPNLKHKKRDTEDQKSEIIDQKPEATQPIKVPFIDTFKGRIGAIFSRRASTEWTPKEIKALHALTITEDDMKLIEGFYGEPRASWQEPAPYLWKKDMLTLLNNWTSAIDRARGYVRPAGQSGPELVDLAAKYIAADPADPYLSKSIQLKAKEMCGPKGFDMLLEEVAKQKRNAKPV
jgi:hypothetical protein